MFEKIGKFISLLCNSSKLIVSIYKTILFCIDIEKLGYLPPHGAATSHKEFPWSQRWITMVPNCSLSGEDKATVLSTKHGSGKHHFCSHSIDNYLGRHTSLQGKREIYYYHVTRKRERHILEDHLLFPKQMVRA